MLGQILIIFYLAALTNPPPGLVSQYPTDHEIPFNPGTLLMPNYRDSAGAGDSIYSPVTPSSLLSPTQSHLLSPTQSGYSTTDSITAHNPMRV